MTDASPAAFDSGSHKEFVDYYAEASVSPDTLKRFTALRDHLLTAIGRGSEKLDILDVGCGAGTFSILSAELGHRVVGIDVNEQLVQLARDRTRGTGTNPAVEFRVASAMDLPFPDRSFDIVCCPELLEHVEDWQRCIDEFTRVLRPHGLLYLSTTNRLCPKQQEFNLPLYSWYPAFIQRRYVRLAMTTRPEIANYAKYPAFHWFTFYGLRSALRKRGYQRFLDRFDIAAQIRRTGLKRLILTGARTIPGLRLLGQIASSGTVIAAIYGGPGRR
jgi:2-polyprenyl-6-hydroxyphenyl methylase/3-demethylubiquinone-9 3-methyltransferase